MQYGNILFYCYDNLAMFMFLYISYDIPKYRVYTDGSLDTKTVLLCFD